MSVPTSVTTNGWLTPQEVAGKLRRSAKTIRRWHKEEGLPALRVKHRLLFDPGEVDRWVHERGGSTLPVRPHDHRVAIRQLVDAAPPLTAEQADRIRSVLSGGAA